MRLLIGQDGILRIESFDAVAVAVAAASNAATAAETAWRGRCASAVGGFENLPIDPARGVRSVSSLSRKQQNNVAARYAAALIALLAALVGMARNSSAQATAGFAAESSVTMTGRITDSRALPIVGAVITARGGVVGWTATNHDGLFRLSIPAGSYEIVVRKGGYTPATTTVVLSAGATKSVSLVLGEASLSSLNAAT